MRDLAVGGCEKWELVSILRNSKNLKRVAICSNRDAAVLEVDTPPHEFFNNHIAITPSIHPDRHRQGTP